MTVDKAKPAGVKFDMLESDYLSHLCPTCFQTYVNGKGLMRWMF